MDGGEGYEWEVNEIINKPMEPIQIFNILLFVAALGCMAVGLIAVLKRGNK